MIHEQELYNLDDDDDEIEEGDDASSLPPKSQKRGRMLPPMSSSCGSTGKTKGPMDCYFPQKYGDKGGKSGNPQVDAKAILRDRAVTCFARWMYDAGMKPPTYYEVRGPYLKKEVAEVNKILEEHKVEWNKFGCSIMMDKWRARNGKMIINILVNSPKGSLFLESVDASDSSTDSTKMYSLFKSAIDSIGAENVVQVVTYNASENVKAGYLMSTGYPHIYWTPCAAHSINLIFGDIFKERPFSTVFNQAIRLHSYIVQRPLLLNMMKRFTKQRSLVKPAKTRFATAFLTLHRMYERKSNLKKLFVSDEYTSSAYGREARGRESADIILSPLFWNNVVHALKIGGPLVKVLRLVDGEQMPPMGYLYKAIDRAKEAIQASFTGLVLNPELFYDNEERILGDEPLWNGYYECIEKLIPEESVQDKITEQFSTYRNAEQLFGKNMAIRQRKTKSPIEWWKQYGHSTPDLQKFAIKIHTKKRNKLTLKRLNDLVFIKYNRTLRRRYNARNVIDPISLDNIDDANEWLTGVPEDHADEEVFEDTSDFTWGDVAEARGIGERIYGLRGSTSTSSSQRKGKQAATLSLVDEEDEVEEDDEQYNNDSEIQEFDNLVEEYDAHFVL
ncbi:PREDICTED: uncharacterized protein LOC109230057 [Nicotiana attenuata]|uniref:uncharacterized protein LOC109230057 n=1 Tax=Nicotiana attenuata TaxID=49451 RepID=UPI000905B2C7|nr:PREDICTED: uncharacterized protein LOC109230057 [Nicotiana attenuata]